MTPAPLNDNEERSDLPAGGFSEWLIGVQAAMHGDADSDVACDGCTACCTSSQFVHIGPDEFGPLSRIPDELLFPAPMMPAGNMLMGYDERGHCPMLTDDGCSIYDERPRTCRTYDCRIFPAAGVGLDHDESQISLRARRWRFDHPTTSDTAEHGAVRSAARFISEHGDPSDEGRKPSNDTQLAVLAVRYHERFVLPTSPTTPEAGPDD